MGAPFPLDRVDDVLGDAVERLVAAHHRRRLARHGHRPAAAPPGGWAEGGSFPPRAGNRVELLVDGAELLPRMVEDVGRAWSHVHVAGWFFTPSFRMGGEGPTLRGLLADAATRCDVRVLAWAGAPLPLFHPDRGEVRGMRDELTRGTRVEMHLDAKERPMHCHHEKLVVVDDRVAYVGGLDLTTFAGNRFDSSAHEPRVGIGWHDACLRVEGPAAADVAAHFRLRWPRPLPEPAAAPGQADGIELQLVRTVPEHVYDGLREGEFTILESYLRALRAAERFVYLESQFLWAPEVVRVLADKLREPPSDEFRVVVLLPAKPNNGEDDTRGQIGVLIDADREGPAGDRFLAGTLFQPGPTGQPVYVHAKVGIVDDTWLTVGSANLNSHSFFNDSEVNVVVRDPAFVRAARLRLWSEHLDGAAEGEVAAVVDERWHELAGAKLRRLPGVSRRSQALWGPINGLIVDG
ncbi:MAG TPA: phospholipase D family protein [Gaiellaceae bacterium]|nr:phospholipase D family protein [Gaiellaceae bacterium]